MIEFQQLFLALQSQYPRFISVFTDGSKTDESVGCAFVVEGKSVNFVFIPKPVFLLLSSMLF